MTFDKKTWKNSTDPDFEEGVFRMLEIIRQVETLYN